MQLTIMEAKDGFNGSEPADGDSYSQRFANSRQPLRRAESQNFPLVLIVLQVRRQTLSGCVLVNGIPGDVSAKERRKVRFLGVLGFQWWSLSLLSALEGIPI